ncbi:unnamed protein product [Pleuronectes platessa]|uniref:Uncharacterized protein n=1 Tax=Pleuronectes platessa TaxID=8262 RepID=A0A9N7UWH1_PLEPL|nr:unnamed protein product [Pleuronectes platessa]
MTSEGGSHLKQGSRLAIFMAIIEDRPLSLPLCPKPGHNSIVRPQWTWQNKLRPSDRQWLSKEHSWATTTRLCIASKIKSLLLFNKPPQPSNPLLLQALLPSNPGFLHQLSTPVIPIPVASFSPNAS